MKFDIVKDGIAGIGAGLVTGFVGMWAAKRASKLLTDNPLITNLLSASATIYANHELNKLNTVPQNKLAMPSGIAAGMLLATLVDASAPKAKPEKNTKDPNLDAETRVMLAEPTSEMVATANMLDADVDSVKAIEYSEVGKDGFNAMFTDNVLRFDMLRDGVGAIYNTDTAWTPISFDQFKELVLQAKKNGLSKVYFLTPLSDPQGKFGGTTEIAFLDKNGVKYEFVETIGSCMADPLRPEVQKIDETYGFPAVLVTQKIARPEVLGIPISFGERFQSIGYAYPWVGFYPQYQGQDVDSDRARLFLLDEIAKWNAADKAMGGKHEIYFVTPSPDHREKWVQHGYGEDFDEAMFLLRKEIVTRGIPLKEYEECAE